MMEKIENLLKDSTISFPKILLCNYKKLNIDELSFIVLIYILNQKDNKFDPQKMSEELDLSLPELLDKIEKLNSADLIKIELTKDNGVMEELIDTSNLYKKLTYFIVNEKEKNSKSNETNIYDNFEKEFGRTLSPIEYELISGWLDNDFSEEIIICALKEAVYNGALSLRYIDKILFEWNKKGIKTKEDIEKDKINFKKNASKKTEMFDYDWLNDES